MSESKADYKVVIDQEANDNGQHHQQQTIVAPSGFKLSPGMRAVLPIASYCFASILMTVTNKYVLSGYDFNMNFLLLTIQVRKLFLFHHPQQCTLKSIFLELGYSCIITIFQISQSHQVSWIR